MYRNPRLCLLILVDRFTVSLGVLQWRGLPTAGRVWWIAVTYERDTYEAFGVLFEGEIQAYAL